MNKTDEFNESIPLRMKRKGTIIVRMIIIYEEFFVVFTSIIAPYISNRPKVTITVNGSITLQTLFDCIGI